VRFMIGASNVAIEGVDQTLMATYQPLAFNGSLLAFSTSGTDGMRLIPEGLMIGSTAHAWGVAGRGLIEINGSATALLGFKVGGAAKGYVFHDGYDMQVTNSVAAGYLYLRTGSKEVSFSPAGLLAAPSIVSYVTSGTASVRAESAGSLITDVGTITAQSGSYQTYMQQYGHGLAYLMSTCTTFVTGTTGNAPWMVVTNWAERLRVTGAGDVGIGTSNPAGILHAYKASGAVNFLAQSGSTADPWADNAAFTATVGARSTYLIQYAGGQSYLASNGTALALLTSGASPLLFFTNNVERLAIESNGMVDFKALTATAAAAVASTHKIAVKINGVTYYLLASDV
jgi:hypothetical protein